MMNTENTYPVSAGYRNSRSKKSAAKIDSDPGRYMRTQTLTALIAYTDPHYSPDEIGAEIGETPFYIRPRVSELERLGVVQYGNEVTNPSGRTAHTVEATPLVHELLEGETDDDTCLDLLRWLILELREDARQERDLLCNGPCH